MASTSAHRLVRFRLPPLPTIRDVIRLYELGAKKRLAQNFLLDMNLTRKIARCAGDIKNQYVCEVGPGPGGITRALLERGCHRVDVIERDSRFFPGLELLSEASGGRLKIIEGDVLETDIGLFWPRNEIAKGWYDDPPPCHVIGNLPFNIATALMIRWLAAMSERTGPFVYGRTPLTLTFQKEVAERIVAPINTAQRCRLSVMCQYLADCKHLFTIPGKNFVPPPKVDVGVVQITPLEEPNINCHFKLVEKVCRHIFHYRNKRSIRCARTLYPPEMAHGLADDMYRICRISPLVECYKLSIEEIRDMCYVYEDQCRTTPGLYLYDYRKPIDLSVLSEHPDALPPVYRHAPQLTRCTLDEFPDDM